MHLAEHHRKEAIAASSELTQALVDHLNVGCVASTNTSNLSFNFPNDQYLNYFFFLFSVAQAYLNQKRLDAEAKQLHMSATNFAKQTHQWMNLIEGFSSALKVRININFILFIEISIDLIFIAFDKCRKLVTLKTGLEVLKMIWYLSMKH